MVKVINHKVNFILPLNIKLKHVPLTWRGIWVKKMKNEKGEREEDRFNLKVREG